MAKVKLFLADAEQIFDDLTKLQEYLDYDESREEDERLETAYSVKQLKRAIWDYHRREVERGN